MAYGSDEGAAHIVNVVDVFGGPVIDHLYDHLYMEYCMPQQAAAHLRTSETQCLKL